MIGCWWFVLCFRQCLRFGSSFGQFGRCQGLTKVTSGCSTRTICATTRVHTRTQYAVHIKFARWHGICSGMLKIKSQKWILKTFVRSHIAQHVLLPRCSRVIVLVDIPGAHGHPVGAGAHWRTLRTSQHPRVRIETIEGGARHAVACVPSPVCECLQLLARVIKRAINLIALAYRFHLRERLHRCCQRCTVQVYTDNLPLDHACKLVESVVLQARPEQHRYVRFLFLSVWQQAHITKFELSVVLLQLYTCLACMCLCNYVIRLVARNILLIKTVCRAHRLRGAKDQRNSSGSEDQHRWHWKV
jgi:hypothetical protein